MRRYHSRDLSGLADAPHYVYRAFDSYGHLLYVGCTKNPKSRLGTHRSQAPWFRFAESVGIAGPHDGRDTARAFETEAIDTEAPYFNSSVADMKRTQANIHEAKQMLWRKGWYEPHPDPAIDPRDDWDAFCAELDRIRPECEAWRRAVERNRAVIKAGAFPYMTDADRMARYLAARENAEAARQERAA